MSKGQNVKKSTKKVALRSKKEKKADKRNKKNEKKNYGYLEK